MSKVKYKRKQKPRNFIAKTLKPQGLSADGPRQIYEFDVKHLPQLPGKSKRYAFCTIDIFNKKTSVMVGTTISSTQARKAIKLAFRKLGTPKILINDHGSENLKHFQKYMEKSPVTHYYCRIQVPQDKPHVERFIGSLERECLQRFEQAYSVKDQQQIINRWLAKYHFFRPHASLNYLTPMKFANSIKTTNKVYTML